MKQTCELNSETELQYQMKGAETAAHDPFLSTLSFLPTQMTMEKI